jgi:hypothetical protein
LVEGNTCTNHICGWCFSHRFFGEILYWLTRNKIKRKNIFIHGSSWHNKKNPICIIQCFIKLNCSWGGEISSYFIPWIL